MIRILLMIVPFLAFTMKLPNPDILTVMYEPACTATPSLQLNKYHLNEWKTNR